MFDNGTKQTKIKMSNKSSIGAAVSVSLLFTGVSFEVTFANSLMLICANSEWGDGVAQLVEHRTRIQRTKVRIPSGAHTHTHKKVSFSESKMLC